MKLINSGLRFLLEIGLLLALAYWGFHNHTDVARWVFGIGAPLLAAGIWGVWIVPKAPYRLSGARRLAVEIALFALGVLALWAVGQPAAALVFGLVVAMNLALLTLAEQGVR